MTWVIIPINPLERGHEMARRKPTGAGGYLRQIAFDVDVAAIRERGNRQYVAYRLRQVEAWLYASSRSIERMTVSQRSSPELMNALMDVAYLLAVRRALVEVMGVMPTA